MYEEEYKELKGQRIPAFIMIGIGIVILVFFGSFCFGGMIRKIGKNEIVEADRVTIDVSYGDEDSSDTYKPTYYYTIGRKKYTYTPWYYTNINVEYMKDTTLYYDPSDPSDVVPEYQTKFHWSCIFIIVFSGIFECIGLAILVGAIKKERKLKHLEKNGTLFRKLPCRIVRTNTYVNEEPLIIIEVDYFDSNGELIVFKQKKLGEYEDVETADLLVDLNDLSMYYIDFEITE